MPARAVWRTKSQTVIGTVFGLLIAALGASAYLRPASKGGGSRLAIVAIMLGLGIAFVFVRAALITTERGIEVRNPLGTVSIPWERVAGFRLGRHGVWAAVCIIDLVDGRSAYAFGIRVAPHVAPARSRERQMITALNALLAAHRESAPAAATAAD